MNEIAVALTILGLVVFLGALAPRFGVDSRDGFGDRALPETQSERRPQL